MSKPTHLLMTQDQANTLLKECRPNQNHVVMKCGDAEVACIIYATAAEVEAAKARLLAVGMNPLVPTRDGPIPVATKRAE